MSSTGKQSPLGMNVLNSLILNKGININSAASSYMGQSTSLSSYTTGSITNIPVIKAITYAIRSAYLANTASPQTLSDDTYNQIISIGSTIGMGAFGNSKPPTFTTTIAPGQFGISPGSAPRGWGGVEWTAGNEATSWGFLKLIPFQAYSEFNYNRGLTASSANIPGTPGYLDFLSSFSTCAGFILTSNQSIISSNNASTFLKGTYSNMNDLITADITGVNLATIDFGNDLIKLGKTIDLSRINAFGVPSVLLLTLQTNNALTQAVVLAILASGISPSRLNSILSENVSATIDEQRKLYGAFCVIVGKDLYDVLVALNCSTPGIESLADLLNLKKMFPVSYVTMTVPVYNAVSTVTNSKTYYLIYNNGDINSQLMSQEISSQFVTAFPDEINYITENETTLSDFERQSSNPIANRIPESKTTNLQPTTVGLGSYLYNIIPKDMAIAAGAFSIAMSQIKNIRNVAIEKFAQVVRNIETIKDLAINGSDVPVDLSLKNQANGILNNGNGFLGTYTMSDFFGSMSGIPYNRFFELLNTKIPTIASTQLLDIYRQLLLTVSWKQATGTIQYTTSSSIDVLNPGNFIYYYTITGITLTDAGGGYQGTAPNIVMPGTAIAKCSIGADPENLDNYGKVFDLTLVSSGGAYPYGSGTSSEPPDPSLELVISPPTGAGWPTFNIIAQELIAQANQELENIKNNNKEIADEINSAWESIGSQLNKELEARARALQPPLVEAENADAEPIGSFPSTQIQFVDAIQDWALNTLPEMEAQTLEAIADLSTVGGQSIIGLMRESRNQARLTEIGIPLDNTIPETLTIKQYSELIANGAKSSLKTDLGSPEPLGVFDPVTGNYLIGNPGSPVPTGKGIVPGSFAGSRYTNLIPPQLNTLYSSNTLLSSTYNIQQSIDEVIRCNCDCWDLL